MADRLIIPGSREASRELASTRLHIAALETELQALPTVGARREAVEKRLQELRDRLQLLNPATPAHDGRNNRG